MTQNIARARVSADQLTVAAFCKLADLLQEDSPEITDLANSDLMRELIASVPGQLSHGNSLEGPIWRCLIGRYIVSEHGPMTDSESRIDVAEYTSDEHAGEEYTALRARDVAHLAQNAKTALLNAGVWLTDASIEHAAAATFDHETPVSKRWGVPGADAASE